MHGTQHSPVSAGFPQCRDGSFKFRLGNLPQHLFAKLPGNAAHFRRNCRIASGQVCMISAAVDDAQGIACFFQIQGHLPDAGVVRIRKVNGCHIAKGACHLIHQTAWLAEKDIFRILPDLGDGNRCFRSVSKKGVDDISQQDFKRRRAGQTGALQHAGGGVGVKPRHRIAKLDEAGCNPSDQGGGGVGFLRHGNPLGQVDEILRIALGLDPDQIGAVGGGGGDHIQAYPGSQHAAVLMIRVVAAELRSAGNRKQACAGLMIGFLIPGKQIAQPFLVGLQSGSLRAVQPAQLAVILPLPELSCNGLV